MKLYFQITCGAKLQLTKYVSSNSIFLGGSYEEKLLLTLWDTPTFSVIEVSVCEYEYW